MLGHGEAITFLYCADAIMALSQSTLDLYVGKPNNSEEGSDSDQGDLPNSPADMQASAATGDEISHLEGGDGGSMHSDKGEHQEQYNFMAMMMQGHKKLVTSIASTQKEAGQAAGRQGKQGPQCQTTMAALRARQ